MKQTITSMNVETKKGTVQRVSFHIYQDRPYPSIKSNCGQLKWENGEGIFPDYNQKTYGIAEKYTCNLLRNDKAPEEMNLNNRGAFAGYVEYQAQPDTSAPGTITLRGRDLGEMSIHLEPQYFSAKVNGFGAPSDGERAWIDRNIVPLLRDAVERNKETLYAEAVQGVKNTIAQRFADIADELETLKQEAQEAIAKL